MCSSEQDEGSDYVLPAQNQFAQFRTDSISTILLGHAATLGDALWAVECLHQLKTKKDLVSFAQTCLPSGCFDTALKEPKNDLSTKRGVAQWLQQWHVCGEE